MCNIYQLNLRQSLPPFCHSFMIISIHHCRTAVAMVMPMNIIKITRPEVPLQFLGMHSILEAFEKEQKERKLASWRWASEK